MIHRIRGLFARLHRPASPPPDPERPTSDHVYESLSCLDRSGRLLACTLGWADGPRRHVTVTVPDAGVQVDAEGFDLFDAFLSVRRTLEGKGMRIVCAGARADCWPSGMARQMGAGETAYVLVPGVPADLADRVYIFAPADPAQIATVDEQSAAYRRWLDSLPDDEDEG